MVIFNTTYHAAHNVTADFIEWLRSEYIPTALASGELSLPQLTRVMTDDPEANGVSYALQFHAQSVEALEVWYRRTGTVLLQKLNNRFNQDVVGFSTLMEKLELE